MKTKRHHHIKYLFLLLLLLSVAIPQTDANIELPELGDSSAGFLSAEEDRLLGQIFMRKLRIQVNIMEDPAITAYINALGYRLLASADTDLPFNFFVVDSPEINAFAGPGGYIGINSGLITTAESEAELAAVVAHEIAHVSQRHLARAFKKASAANMQTAAAIIAAILLGGHSGQLAEATIMASTAGNIQQQLNFTRQHEQEADRIGINTLSGAGYDPQQMAQFFYRLQQSYRYAGEGVPELLRTHPVTQSRIADATNRALQMPAPPAAPETLEFGLLKAKLNSLTMLNNPAQIKALEKTVLESQGDSKTFSAYQLALVKLKQGHYETATRESQHLLEMHPDQPWFIALAAEIELAENKPDLAKERLTKALKLYPHHPLLTTLFANALLQINKPENAAIQIRGLIQQQKDFVLPGYYHLLANAETAANNKADAYQALAEYYYLIGETRTAINQLDKALTHTNEPDTFRRERIQARLRDLKQELLMEEEFEKK